MTDTCGLTSCEPFAKWDRDSQSWKTSEATSLWALTLSSLTLPTWGGLHDGELCEHPTPELHTSAPDFSSLPTPRPSDTNGAGFHGDGGPNLRTAVTMLPTPTRGDGEGGGKRTGVTWESTTKSTGDGGASRLRDVVSLLPTPAVNDMGEGKTLEWWDDWAPRQKAADGRPAPHGRSLAIEAQRLLPTPRAQDEYERRNMKTMERIRDEGGDMTLPTWAKVVAPTLPTPTSRDWKGANQRADATCLHGAITAQPSNGGSTSSDDPHQHQLSLDDLALPA